jgi:hypothetical protein
MAVGEKLSIITQVTIERGSDGGGRQRPDMLISVGQEPWLLFENKVSHTVDQVQIEGQLESQLHRYAKWLSRQKFSLIGLGQGIVFLTHLILGRRGGLVI